MFCITDCSKGSTGPCVNRFDRNIFRIENTTILTAKWNTKIKRLLPKKDKNITVQTIHFVEKIKKQQINNLGDKNIF